jgi:hypothetical protein
VTANAKAATYFTVLYTNADRKSITINATYTAATRFSQA